MNPENPSLRRDDSPPRRRYALVHIVAFLAFLSLWTWKLLDPAPVPEAVNEALTADARFLLAKSLHAGGYAFLTVLAATLPFPRAWRRAAVAFLVLHGPLTEYLQYAMALGRYGCVRDVLIDWAGTSAGVAAVAVGRWVWD